MTTWTLRLSGTSLVDNVNIPWTVATRPTSPYLGQTNLNTDFDGLETWDGTAWRIINGTWSTAGRPATASISIGSRGFNSDEGMGQESWNGSEWVLG